MTARGAGERSTTPRRDFGARPARHRAAATVLQGLVLLTGCGRREPSADHGPGTSAPGLTAAAMPVRDAGATRAAFVDDPQRVGPAYLATAAGLTLVDAGVVSHVAKAYAKRLAVAPDGAVWNVVGKVWRYTPEQGLTRPGNSVASDVAFAKDGTAYLATYDRIVRVSPTGDTETVDAPAHGYMALRVWVDERGTLIAGTDEGMYRQEGTTWKPLPVAALGAHHGVEAFLGRPGGPAYVQSAGAVAQLSENHVLTRLPYAPEGAERGTISSSGGLAFLGRQGALFVEARGKPGRVGLGQLGLAASRMTAAAVDGQGRRWIGTDGGFAITSAAGVVLQRWLPGVLPGMVEDVLLVGAGPVLPAEAPAPQRGSIRGTLIANDAIVANAELELCPSLLDQAAGGATPCAGQAGRLATKTDANGNFTLVNVPRQFYGAAYKRGSGRWDRNEHFACCDTIAPNVETDLGRVDFDVH